MPDMAMDTAGAVRGAAPRPRRDSLAAGDAVNDEPWLVGAKVVTNAMVMDRVPRASRGQKGEGRLDAG